MTDKDKLKGNFDVLIRRKEGESFELARLFNVDLIEFFNNHLMFWKKGKLVFKVWLNEPECYKYKGLKEAMKKANIVVYKNAT